MRFVSIIDNPGTPENVNNLLAALPETQTRPEPITLDGPTVAPTQQRPGDDYNARVRPEEVLEAHGWTHHHDDSQGRHYTRPDKNRRDGSSATVYPDGHVCVWTDATELEPRRWYDAFGLYAALAHGGDHQAATEALRGQGYGEPKVDWQAVVAKAHEPTDGRIPWLIDWQAFWTGQNKGEDWLIEPLVARGRGHALYATAKTGKSYVMLAAVAAACAGRPTLLRPEGKPLTALYLDYEMTEDDLRERLEEFGYTPADDLTRLHYALLPPLAPLNTKEGGEAIVTAAIAVEAELVVIDTTSRAVTGSEQENDTYIAFYEWCGKELKRRGIAYLRIDHAGKDLAKGQRGASAKNDDVDVVWSLARPEDGKLIAKATHTRVSWVRDFEITRTDQDGVVGFTAVPPSWPTGTRGLLELLNEAKPLKPTERDLRALMKERGKKGSNEAVRMALRLYSKGTKTVLYENGAADGAASDSTLDDKTARPSAQSSKNEKEQVTGSARSTARSAQNQVVPRRDSAPLEGRNTGAPAATEDNYEGLL